MNRILCFALVGVALRALCGSAPGDLAAETRFFDIRTGREIPSAPINRDTISGFELLYATPGTGDVAEIAGHLLLRIKRAPSQGRPEGEDIVLSFLADTGDPVPSADPPDLPDCRNRNWLNLVRPPAAPPTSPLASILQSLKGLTGGFPVAMDLQTLDYTLKTYTVEQDRTLHRYELNLTDAMRTALIDHLIRLQSLPPPNYYFFHQNCGSVLVREIGRGLEQSRVAEFRPAVSPPHTLVALLLRENLARPVFPSFHGFRNRGFLHRRRFIRDYETLRETSPRVSWPETKRFLHGKESHRARAVTELRELAFQHPELHADFYALASLVQNMEMVFDPKDRLCRDYTSEATAEARRLQRDLLQTGFTPSPASEPVVPLSSAPPTGNLHTGLYPLSLAPALLNSETSPARAALTVGASVLKQEMGEPSRVAMQRAGFVELGGVSALLTKDGAEELRLIGLDMRKFRENLGRVASGLRSRRGWGIGLKVLEIEKRTVGPEWTGSAAGVSGLINLWSSPEYQSHAHLGAGMDFGFLHDDGDTEWGLRFPLRFESLLTLPSALWRTRVTYTHPLIENAEPEWRAVASLELPLGEWRGAGHSLRLAGDVLEIGGESRWIASLGIDIRRF